MNDNDDFFAEQDKRMSIPDEDVDEYIQTRLAAARKNGSLQGRYGGLEDLPGSSRNNKLHAPLPSSFGPPNDSSKPSQQGVPFGAAPHPPGPGDLRGPLRFKRPLRHEPAREDSRVEIGDSGKKSNPVSHGSVSETLTRHSTPAAIHRVKRQKTTGEYSNPNSTIRSPQCNAIEDPPTSRTGAGTSGALVDEFSGDALANPRVSQRARTGTTVRNSVFSSTDLARGNDLDPITRFKQVQTIQPSDPSASTTREISRRHDAPLITMPDDPSVMELVSPSPVSSCREAAVPGSTTSDGHGASIPRSLEEHPPSLPAGVIPPITDVHPNNVAPSLSRLSDASHEAGPISKNPAPQTPAGINTTTFPDCSNITSPGDTPSGCPRRVSHVPTTEAQPSSSRLPRKTVNSDRRARKASGNKHSGKQMKDKPKLMTPLEYAQKLQSHLGFKTKSNYLHGKRIYYIGGDLTYASATTRGRMDYIVKHGGTLVPKYDPAVVTHIVTDAGVPPTLRSLSLKSLSDIPEHIPTVTWKWVISGYGRVRKPASKSFLESNNEANKGKGKADDNSGDESDVLDYEFMHAAFSERIDAGRSWKNARRGKQGGKVVRDPAPRADIGASNQSGDVSHISTFSQDRTEERGVALTVFPPAPLELKAVDHHKASRHSHAEERTKAVCDDDPLAEYYAQARADSEAQWNRDASDSDEEDEHYDYHRGPLARRGFTCDIKGQKKPTVCVNQHIVDKLEELRELHKAKSTEDDRWRAYSYGKCIPAIRNYAKPIRSFNEARSIRGVGEKTAMKIVEIINTGDLKRIKYENTEDVASTRVFQGIYGVGRHTAFVWFANGLRTLDDVKARKGGLKLSAAQEIGLEFYDDISSRMPREEARRIFEMIKPIGMKLDYLDVSYPVNRDAALGIDSKLFIEIMGSYRRGKADCGDIDVLITRPTADGKTHQGVLRILLEKLRAAGILTEDLAVPEDFSDLELIYRGLCKLPDPGSKRRRIDFLCVPWASRGAALLYYTGDDIFNRAMRLKANKHGYSLNQRGLYADVLRDPRNRQKKVSEGHIIASETEEEIFKILGVPWQEPHERVRG